MRIGIGVVCDDGYAYLLKVLLKSIKHHNPGFDNNFYVHCDHRLSKEARKEISKVYPVIYNEVDPKKYETNGKTNIKFYSIENFNMPEDKMIQLGADCFCMQSIEPILNTDVKIGMPREKRRPDIFSSGIIIIGKHYLNQETYKALLKADYSHVKMFGNDMKLYNCYFKDKIEEVDYRFDVVDSELDFIPFEDIIFLHLIHKPFQCHKDMIPQKVWDKWNFYKEL